MRGRGRLPAARQKAHPRVRRHRMRPQALVGRAALSSIRLWAIPWLALIVVIMPAASADEDAPTMSAAAFRQKVESLREEIARGRRTVAEALKHSDDRRRALDEAAAYRDWIAGSPYLTHARARLSGLQHRQTRGG